MQTTTAPRADTSNVPAHVPRDLIIDFDPFVTNSGEDPFESLDRFHGGPRILYTPVHYAGSAGAWVLTRAEDMNAVMGDPGLFASKAKSGMTALIGETWDLAPLEVDPPEHRQLRAILDPIFAPKRINALEPELRRFCNKLIDGLRRSSRSGIRRRFRAALSGQDLPGADGPADGRFRAVRCLG